MAYVKATDGAVTRVFNLDNPKSRKIFKELINNNTGFNVVVENGTIQPKEFTEAEIKELIDAARTAAKVAKPKLAAPANRLVADEE